MCDILPVNDKRRFDMLPPDLYAQVINKIIDLITGYDTRS